MAEARVPWTSLAERSDNVFSSWEWADVWWRHFGKDRSLRISVVSRGAKPLAILPTHTEQRRGLHVSRFVGHGVADQLGPVCDPGYASVAMSDLVGALSPREVLLAERMLHDRDGAHGVRGHVVRDEASPVIDLAREGSWESYLSSRSRHFRRHVGHRARRLQRGLGLTFRLVQDRDRLPADFDALVALHNARWGARSMAFRGAREAFHREFAACALERGWLRLWIAEAEGMPAAAWYGFRFADVEYYYQAGRDAQWDRFSIGAGIVEHSIREAFADGMREYRFLRGGEAYKARYATGENRLRTVVAARGKIGRGAVAAVHLLAGSAIGRRVLRLESVNPQLAV